MDCSTAKGKDRGDREGGGGTAAHSVFWKCLLNAREGSRDLSILLLGEEHRDLYPPLHRVVTLPTFPGVCHALTGGRGQRERTSLCPRNKLQTTLCDPQVQGHHQGPQDMVFKRREPGQSKNGSSPNSKSRPSPDPLQGPPHTHIHRPSRQTPRFCGLGQICLINLNLKRNA